jgi:hypothetical protein
MGYLKATQPVRTRETERGNPVAGDYVFHKGAMHPVHSRGGGCAAEDFRALTKESAKAAGA